MADKPSASLRVEDWKARAEELEQELIVARRIAGLGCDANNYGAHEPMKDGKYTFCTKCGETLTGASLSERLSQANARAERAEASSLRVDREVIARLEKRLAETRASIAAYDEAEDGDWSSAMPPEVLGSFHEDEALFTALLLSLRPEPVGGGKREEDTSSLVSRGSSPPLRAAKSDSHNHSEGEER